MTFFSASLNGIKCQSTNINVQNSGTNRSVLDLGFFHTNYRFVRLLIGHQGTLVVLTSFSMSFPSQSSVFPINFFPPLITFVNGICSSTNFMSSSSSTWKQFEKNSSIVWYKWYRSSNREWSPSGYIYEWWECNKVESTVNIVMYKFADEYIPEFETCCPSRLRPSSIALNVEYWLFCRPFRELRGTACLWCGPYFEPDPSYHNWCNYLEGRAYPCIAQWRPMLIRLGWKKSEK